MPDIKPNKLLTRRGLVAYVRDRFGVPVSHSMLNKSRMVYGEPKPDSYYGPRELFTEQTADRYVLEYLLSDKPTRLLPGKPHRPSGEAA